MANIFNCISTPFQRNLPGEIPFRNTHAKVDRYYSKELTIIATYAFGKIKYTNVEKYTYLPVGGTDNNSKQEDAKLSMQCTRGGTVQHAQAPSTVELPLMSILIFFQTFCNCFRKKLT